MQEPRSLEESFDSFDGLWEPRVVGRVNDYVVKIAKAEGEHVEHVHSESAECFHVLAGELTLDLPTEGRSVTVSAGEIFTVPQGLRHRPSAEPGTRILLFEPEETVSTGDSAIPGTSGLELG